MGVGLAYAYRLYARYVESVLEMVSGRYAIHIHLPTYLLINTV